MHAVLRKILATKPAVFAVGRGENAGRVRDIAAVRDGVIFRGDNAGCWMRCCQGSSAGERYKALCNHNEDRTRSVEVCVPESEGS